MYTLIEIFDSKQYENIITPVTLSDIEKLIYIGTKNVMTREKRNRVSVFFKQYKPSLIVEFFTVERDDFKKTESTINHIIKSNDNCIFDVTGGEDVILTIVGMCAQIYSVPVIRTNPDNGKITLISGKAKLPVNTPPVLTVSDLIHLQGGRILNSVDIKEFSEEECCDIKNLFAINASDCEAYSFSVNFMSECISDDLSEMRIPENKFRMLRPGQYTSIKKIINMLIDRALITRGTDKNDYSYKIKNNLIAVCLKKAGNILEYYTAMAVLQLNKTYGETRLGATIEWQNRTGSYDTQNEIDVLTVSHNFPVFISCKNGGIKKEALYELDAVSRALGGVYTKKILVCTYISENASSREHFIKRAKDMNINLVYDVHKKSFEQFLNFLKSSEI